MSSHLHHVWHAISGANAALYDGVGETMSALPVPEFGVREPDKTYVDRPGAYAVAQDHEGRFAAVAAYATYFLLGGGIDPGEEPEAALLREVLEESR